MYRKRLFCLLLIASLSIINGALYDRRDNVVPVNHDLEKVIQESGAGKLVQFMNSFCKDSQNFIPGFTKLARDLYKWQRVLKVYVVDCAIEENWKMCRDYRVLNTPELRYFPSEFRSERDGVGTTIPNSDFEDVKMTVAHHLYQLKNHAIGQPNFKRLDWNDNITTIFKGNSATYIALIFQTTRLSRFRLETPTIGWDTLLELLPFKEVAVRILNDRKIFINFGLSEHPDKLVLIDKAGKIIHLSTKNETSEGYVDAIEQFLRSRNYQPQSSLANTLPLNIEGELREITLETLSFGPTRIYQADLERAIDNIINVELPKVAVIDGKRLIVLRNILTLLNYLNPLKKIGKLWLKNLYNTLIFSRKNDTEINGNELLDFLKSSVKYKFDGSRYVGCISIKDNSRDFNCSLWTLFHFMTVKAAKSPNLFKPGDILWAFHGYANYFLGCKQCYVNFWEFSMVRSIEEVKTHDDEILWLWEAHNDINRRLAFRPNEDPRFPKVQFPLKKDCLLCRDENSKWQKDEVLKYLKRIFSFENLSWFGMSTSKAYI